MKHIFIALALCWAGSAGAEGFPCREPQYAELKDMSKSELEHEYCSLTEKAISNRRSMEITEQMIAEKKAKGLYSPGDREIQKQELGAAHTCEAAARSVSSVLHRRFKSRPPQSCV